MKPDFETVLVMAQALLQNDAGDAPLTQEAIAAKVDAVFSLSPRFLDSVNRTDVIRELEARFSIWIGHDSTLRNDDDHVAWLTSERKEGWRYWPRYRQFMEKSLSPAATDALDNGTDEILSLLEDPNRTGPWDRRGLVVGHVQSGKTGNYIGLISKAADAGYKLILVLAGIHKNLRSQTQIRLDEGFLGYVSTSIRGGESREAQPIGVGLIDSQPARPDTITTRSDNGDFNAHVARHFGINPGSRPLLFVVKKNTTVLKNILAWIDWAATRRDPETRRPIISDVPLLIVDDEADHASVDTRQQAFDESGRPDPEHDPTAINTNIRRILFSFEKAAYVGYTATPFANIFIHDRGKTSTEGEDLFPRSFIISLAAPSNYVGPARLFGLDVTGSPENDALPLMRSVTDHAESLSLDETQGWMPPKHFNGHRPLFKGNEELPASLRTALLSFLVSCCARRARGQVSVSNSMLVHVTRFTSVQKLVLLQINQEIERLKLKTRYKDGGSRSSLERELRSLWEDDFVPTTRIVRIRYDDPGITHLSWNDIWVHFEAILDDLHLREINGTARDVLDYEIHKATGINIIAVGGDKLARGLTLEGLTVSYFLRASKMYDTLMQMGRWFGYRPGYLDLCRLFTSPDLIEWFQHIAEASEELRQEFSHMAAVGGTPKDYGLRVRSHPTLLITSRVKMRNGIELSLSYAGSISETVVFYRDANTVALNFRTAESFLASLGVPDEVDPVRERPNGLSHSWNKTYLWTSVPVQDIKNFLVRFKTHPQASRADSRLLHEYVKQQESAGELLEWTVAVISSGTGTPGRIAGLDIGLIERTPRTSPGEARDYYAIRRLLSPRDEAIDLDKDAYAAALRTTLSERNLDSGRSQEGTLPETPSGPSIREQRSAQNGLLLLYPLSPSNERVEGNLPAIGFGFSFPGSGNARPVTYKVNNVFWSQEYGEFR
jgi:hypothetical protein